MDFGLVELDAAGIKALTELLTRCVGHDQMVQRGRREFEGSPAA